MKRIKTFQGTIYPWNCDHMGHMNVKFYVEMFDQAIWNLFSYLGLTSGYFKDNDRGMVAVEQHIKYHKEVLPGENIFIESEIISIKEKIILIHHIMYSHENDEKVAETEITGLHIDTKIRKGVVLPEFVQKNFQDLFKED